MEQPLGSRCCANSDEIQDDEESEVTNSHEVVDSFPRTYSNAAHQYYPWRLWNFPYYQPRTPQMPFAGSGGGSPPMADPRFVSTNRCNPRQPYNTTMYPCWTTTVTFTTATLTTTTTVTTTVYPPTTTPYTTTTDTTTTAVTTSSTPSSTTPPSTSSTDSSTASSTTGTTYSTTTPPLAVG
ncbi:hypothetical protein DAPPUDRAFT_266636 [Daphnia pulex]|uniref:Uncharacterized protein n=1 Tax=Daphnia pulex TaxID=6669 RepID=E9HVB9_DAPPU|nr:hypothetical protein DAPPUDRAFT_266636 [Daphnia pulex]|eukprot:EFX64298.1 hypothetical protein DAPPUDRAFT_266636 [Daphnia pulex]